MVRSVVNCLLLVCLGMILACGGAGAGGTDQAYITSVYPCKAAPGDTVTMKGSFGSGGSPVVSIGGTSVVLDSWGRTTIVFKMPAGASGKVTVTDANGSATSSDTCSAGAPAAVNEVEPNDDINGTDATPDLSNHIMTGVLSSESDRDHFYVTCLPGPFTYTVNLSPRVVGIIYVNGTGVALDGSGNATINGVGDAKLFGLTGGTGAYTLTVTQN